MPELPEVEVTRRGIAPYIDGQIVQQVILRREGLRWPFPDNLPQLLQGQPVLESARRGKYLLLHFPQGVLILHLGMSGHLRILPPDVQVQKHDHVDLIFCRPEGGGERVLRFTDPRRFGALLWHSYADGPWQEYPLLKKLGIEPLEGNFDGRVLFDATRNRSTAIKSVLLAGDIVVGVGNIYCSESLFHAAINPKTQARRIALPRYERLAQAIVNVLVAAINKGGSSLKDFVQVNGQSGYFQQDYFVYARQGLPCRVCSEPIRQIEQGQRSTFYCPRCQH